jgi:rubrerythrin
VASQLYGYSSETNTPSNEKGNPFMTKKPKEQPGEEAEKEWCPICGPIEKNKEKPGFCIRCGYHTRPLSNPE